MFLASARQGSRALLDAINTLNVLLNHGANKDFTNNQGEKAYDLALKANYPELARLLK